MALRRQSSDSSGSQASPRTAALLGQFLHVPTASVFGAACRMARRIKPPTSESSAGARAAIPSRLRSCWGRPCCMLLGTLVASVLPVEEGATSYFLRIQRTTKHSSCNICSATRYDAGPVSRTSAPAAKPYIAQCTFVPLFLKSPSRLPALRPFFLCLLPCLLPCLPYPFLLLPASKSTIRAAARKRVDC